MRLLVAIANHGTGNRQYLDQLLAAYREMPIFPSLVVLSNIPKRLGDDVEVRVGIPSKDPWSLPFGHRVLFRERLNDFDYFIYSEDDTLVSWKSLEAFFDSVNALGENEIAGFLRTEQSQDGRISYSSCHSFFRWIPSSVRMRGGQLWAKYSNEHSGFFIANRQQIRRGISSGGFPVEPHQGRYDLLVTAATDIYTRCGFERLICLDRIPEFSLKHLPNKYIGIMGLPAEELEWQISALRDIYSGSLPSVELFYPETTLPGRAGSKLLRENPDLFLNEMLDGNLKDILVWGAGDGFFEADLQAQGYDVSVYPINAIMGECCRHQGLKVLPITEKASLGRKFDWVILRNVLHLVRDPKSLLEEIRHMLRPRGRVFVQVPNFHYCGLIKQRWKRRFRDRKWTCDPVGARSFTGKSMMRLIANAGFSRVDLKEEIPARFRSFDAITLSFFSEILNTDIYCMGQRI